MEAYRELQLSRINNIPPSGVAFPMVKKLLAFNNENERLVDVIILSRNDPVTSLRVFRAIHQEKLDIERGCFTRGNSPFPYLSAFNADLFLSASREDARAAIKNKIPAAHVMGGTGELTKTDDILRIAFDGDAVLFGDEAEQIYQKNGLLEFNKRERKEAKIPLQPGPLKPFFDALWKLREKRPDKIRTALITARGSMAHERPIRTLMSWKVEVDEVFYLGGKPKESLLKAFSPDFFFDDQVVHLRGMKNSAHVEYGVVNTGKGAR